MLRIANEALTFDDVLLLPAFSNVLPSHVTLKSQLTKNILLNIPLISSAMDTVTEARLAIAIAQEGGIGIVHKNMTIEQQAREVRAVKKYESGIIRDPVTIGPEATLFNFSFVDLVSEGKSSIDTSPCPSPRIRTLSTIFFNCLILPGHAIV